MRYFTFYPKLSRRSLYVSDIKLIIFCTDISPRILRIIPISFKCNNIKIRKLENTKGSVSLSIKVVKSLTEKQMFSRIFIILWNIFTFVRRKSLPTKYYKFCIWSLRLAYIANRVGRQLSAININNSILFWYTLFWCFLFPLKKCLCLLFMTFARHSFFRVGTLW